MQTKFRLLGTSALIAAALPSFAADPELLVFDWSGFEEDGFSMPYAEIYGEHPTYTFFGEEEEAFQKLRSGFRADVAQPCPQSVQKWREAGLIEPWDVSKIPNYEKVAEVYKTNPSFVIDGAVYFIPGHIGSTAIAYNTEEVPQDAVQTLQVFADPTWAGRISLPDNVDDIYALAFLATGISDWTTATEADIDTASNWLREVHPNVRTYWNDGAELGQLMGTGEVLISWAWSETPAQLVAADLPIGFEREPREGSSMFACGYVNLADGPGSEDKAHAFMNSFLDASVTEYITSEWGYGHGNAEAMAQIGSETLEEIGLSDIDAPVLYQVPMEIPLREKMITDFERIKAGF
ncbi:polyamine ABC transporter substrate-binding protein [Meridianimarinicoccus roseus]|uniref:Polyamine ABC transporter substrate-binding protein n=1 Tax=Meridianimarinicoccus roseus TaxID=2072018 RepID=A0A2V2L917_9RHOB|nr:extracellular solute-binding protein [Meridianimarinicoccus roseus]PWR01938.1 polyamine ABC transporter substrate-binding protein [Meridianimarinicoccus roseus]